MDVFFIEYTSLTRSMEGQQYMTVFDVRNFIPPLEILTSYYQLTLNKFLILIVFLQQFLLFFKKDFFSFNHIFLLKKYVITHTLLKNYVITHKAKTHLPCFILKCFNQVYYYASISLLFCVSVGLVT